MNMPTPTLELCQSLLSKWRANLELSNYETAQFSRELQSLDKQLIRLNSKKLKIAVFGRVGVGKSSLLNALFDNKIFPTDVAHGCTRKSKGIIWKQKIFNINEVELIDTPGIDEVAAQGRANLASRVALNSDLVLLVIDSDITNIEIEALETLFISGKPVLLVLNRCDQWDAQELARLVQSIKDRLPISMNPLSIECVSAAPRKAKLMSDGRVRSELCSPQISSLKETLIHIIKTKGELLLYLNALKQADSYFHLLKTGRLKRRKTKAQGLIGKFAAIKASGVAANPLLMFDLATGFALDTALIIQLGKLYGLHLKGSSARKLLKQLSLQNTFLGGVQVAIQLSLGAIQNLLLLGTPMTGGLSLVPTGPIALAQAFIAVQATKLTGRLAAEEFLRGSYRKGMQPSSILRGLTQIDPDLKHLVNSWQSLSSQDNKSINTLLP